MNETSYFKSKFNYTNKSVKINQIYLLNRDSFFFKKIDDSYFEVIFLGVAFTNSF